jgi:hypothetical protein
MRTRITIEEVPVEEKASVAVEAPVPLGEAESTEDAEEVTPIAIAGA